MPRSQRNRLRASLCVSAALAACSMLHASIPVAAERPALPTLGQSRTLSSYSLRLTADRVRQYLDARARHVNYLPGEVLVKFKPGAGAAAQQRALMALRSRPSVSDLAWSGDVAIVRSPDQPDAHILADQLSAEPEVQYAEPNYFSHVQPMRQRLVARARAAASRTAASPNDPDFQAYQWNFLTLNMPGAWDINPGATSSLIVASVDTGVTTGASSLSFPLFTGTSIENVPMTFTVSPDLPANRFVRPVDLVFLDGGPVLDMDGHGTHTASTMAEATNNGLALAGIAYNARIMPVKVCVGYWELMIAQAQGGVAGFLPPDSGFCPDDAIAQGIRYAADNGAKVINLSLGGPDPSATLQDAISYAVQHGAFVSIAMGNDFQNGNPPEYPALYASSTQGAMAVGAVGKSLTRAYYSSTGSYCEIAAPGGSDLDPGAGPDAGFIWQTTLFFPDQDPSVIVPRFDRFAETGYIGTSMAAPHVAGLAALLITQGVTAPAAVEALIKQTAKDLGPPGRDNEFGFGLIQPRNALFGFGIRR